MPESTDAPRTPSIAVALLMSARPIQRTCIHLRLNPVRLPVTPREPAGHLAATGPGHPRNGIAITGDYLAARHPMTTVRLIQFHSGDPVLHHMIPDLVDHRASLHGASRRNVGIELDAQFQQL